MAILDRFRGPGSKKKAFFAGLIVALASVLAMAGLGTSRISAATCDANNIIRCGFSGKTDFINMVQSSSELRAIYAHYGLSSSEYGNFENHAVSGKAMRDGRIIVGEKVVATAGRSIGRDKFNASDTPVSISGKTYFENTLDQRFASGVSELSVFVLMGSDGTPAFIVMPSCGNPVVVKPVPKPKPTPPPPAPTPPPAPVVSAICKELTATQAVDNKLAFTFLATAESSGATLQSADFNFGDGNNQNGVTPAIGNPNAVTITHTYATAGTFTTGAVLHFTGADGREITAPACNVEVSPVAPIAPAVAPIPTPPPVLPNAGAGDVVGLFATATGLGYVGYRIFLLRKHSGIDS